LRSLAAVALLGAACQPTFWSPGGPEPLELDPPLIASFELTCDVDEGRWRLEVESLSWTGGGRLYWSPDLAYVERHWVRSVSAEPDGSADRLVLDLHIVGDWREASPGSSTAIRCAQNPDLVFVLYDYEGESADCVAEGPHPEELMGLEGIPDCL